MPGKPAARVTDQTTHGSPLAPGPGSLNTQIGFLPAWRTIIDQHACPAASISGADGVGSVIMGSPTVLINNQMACRVMDIVVEKPGLALGPVNPIAMGCPTVLIGEVGMADMDQDVGVKAPAVVTGTAKADTKGKAIQIIKESEFAKTEEGKKVINKIEDLEKAGKIKFESMAKTTRGAWSSGEIKINDAYKDDPDAVVSELVHEATHAVNEDEFPASKTKITIDEEMRTNNNQLDLYEEQRRNGYRDPELENRRNARKKGKLRDNVRKRYPKTPEHL